MANATTAINITLVHEGGFQDNPADKGNWYAGKLYGTKYGITAADVAKYFPTKITDPNCVRDLSVDEAITIYQEGWWNKLYNDINDQSIANKLFDIGVLLGVETAVKLLQISLYQDGVISVVEDGKFGEQTLADVNEKGNLASYRVVLNNHLMAVVNSNPSDAQFLAGWVKRVNS